MQAILDWASDNPELAIAVLTLIVAPALARIASKFFAHDATPKEATVKLPAEVREVLTVIAAQERRTGEQLRTLQSSMDGMHGQIAVMRALLDQLARRRD